MPTVEVDAGGGILPAMALVVGGGILPTVEIDAGGHFACNGAACQ